MLVTWTGTRMWTWTCCLSFWSETTCSVSVESENRMESVNRNCCQNLYHGACET